MPFLDEELGREFEGLFCFGVVEVMSEASEFIFQKRVYGGFIVIWG